jgi:short-subunit dehydrogenase
MRELAGRTALLTGASSGLGPFIARRLHREGVRFILSARRQAELDRLARELVGSSVITADLSRRGEAERLAAEAGEVDILVLNAGVPASGPLTDFDVQDIDAALEVNLRAPIALARLLLPRMLERGSGHIVLMASMAGQVPAPGNSVYNATKFALRGFGHALRGEVHGRGVSVSVVSPVFVTGAGMFADTGARAPGREVPVEKVAEATLTAIRADRSEITVAPLGLRLAARLPLAFPAIIHTPLFRNAGALPTDAVEKRQSGG